MRSRQAANVFNVVFRCRLFLLLPNGSAMELYGLDSCNRVVYSVLSIKSCLGQHVQASVRLKSGCHKGIDGEEIAIIINHLSSALFRGNAAGIGRPTLKRRASNTNAARPGVPPYLPPRMVLGLSAQSEPPRWRRLRLESM